MRSVMCEDQSNLLDKHTRPRRCSVVQIALGVRRRSGGKGGSRPCQCRMHSFLRRGAGRDFIELGDLERRQRAVVEREGQSGASGVGDLGAHEVERLELRQPSSRRRQRTCRRRRRHEGGEALVAERVAPKIETH
eukprot:scaffold121057_cov63-Phaeocystis_antarctica.AAC.2